MPYNIDRLHELDEVGVVGFKASLRPVAIAVSTTTSVTSMTAILQRRAEAGRTGPASAGARENALICDALGEEAKREGRVLPMTMWLRVRYLPKWKRFAATVPGESRWLPSARLPRQQPEGVEEVTRARQEGQDVTCESARITLCWIPISSKKSVLWRRFTADPRSGKPERHVGKTV